MSSDDEFDIDFVSKASKTVSEKWQKIEKTKVDNDELKDVTNTNNGLGCPVQKKKKKSNNFMDSNDALTHSKDRNIGSDEEDDDTEVDDRKKKSEVSITPPGSPAGIERVKVRGAKASKKTVNALNKLQIDRQKLHLLSGRRDRELEEDEDCRLVDMGPQTNKFMLKICWKSTVERLEVSSTDRIGKVTEEFIKKVGAEQGELSLYREELAGDPLGREQSLADLGVSLVTVLHARTRVVTAEEAEKELLKLKLRTVDKRAQVVVVKIKPSDTMETVMNKYSEETGIERNKLKFYFDGEELQGGDSAEDLELEGEECFDVHVKK